MPTAAIRETTTPPPAGLATTHRASPAARTRCRDMTPTTIPAILSGAAPPGRHAFRVLRRLGSHGQLPDRCRRSPPAGQPSRRPKSRSDRLVEMGERRLAEGSRRRFDDCFSTGRSRSHAITAFFTLFDSLPPRGVFARRAVDRHHNFGHPDCRHDAGDRVEPRGGTKRSATIISAISAWRPRCISTPQDSFLPVAGDTAGRAIRTADSATAAGRVDL